MSKFWNSAKDWLEAISYFCVVLGITFAVYQYLKLVQTNKEQTAVSYILEFQSDELVKSRLKLQRDWFAYPISEISGKPGSSGVIDDLALSFTFPKGEAPTTDDLIKVVDFLDLIGACVEAQVCYRGIVERHLGNYVKNLNCLYQAPLKNLRKTHNLAHLGIAMQEIIKTDMEC